jgi:hypothetical protein
MMFSTCNQLFVFAGIVASVAAGTAVQSVQVAEDITAEWLVDNEGNNGGIPTLIVSLTVPQATNWLGFGIGEDGVGAMVGADIVLCTRNTDASGEWTVVDSYAVAESIPLRDDQQDWTFVSAATTDG